jgi:hypothetical protein
MGLPADASRWDDPNEDSPDMGTISDCKRCVNFSRISPLVKINIEKSRIPEEARGRFRPSAGRLDSVPPFDPADEHVD